jgi:hypothetical protein
MAPSQQNTDRLYRIAEKHCLKFYICPLCFTAVIIANANLFYCNVEFDRDHFPAASIGGRKTLLVCKPCNSRFGRTIDYSIKQHHIYHGFLQNGASVNARLSLEGLVDNYSVELKRNNENSFTFIDHHRNSHLLRKFKELGIEKVLNKMPFQIKIRPQIPAAGVFEKSLLKAAYLYFFSIMGYDFGFSYVATRIRRVLDGDEEHPLSNHGVLPDLQESPLSEGIYMLVEPDELKCFFVLLETTLPQAGISQKHMVLIPSFNDGSWENLKAFASVLANREGLFTQIRLSEEAILELPILPYRALTEMFLTGK